MEGGVGEGGRKNWPLHYFVDSIGTWEDDASF